MRGQNESGLSTPAARFLLSDSCSLLKEAWAWKQQNEKEKTWLMQGMCLETCLSMLVACDCIHVCQEGTAGGRVCSIPHFVCVCVCVNSLLAAPNPFRSWTAYIQTSCICRFWAGSQNDAWLTLPVHVPQVGSQKTGLGSMFRLILQLRLFSHPQ